MMIKDTAIITVNWNGVSDTIECLHSLLQQDYPGFTIYCVDNHSKNSDRKRLLNFCENYKPQIKLILLDDNVGFGRAHNYVYETYLKNDPRIKWIALLNNDAIAAENWLNELIQTAQQKKADIIASKMIQYHNRRSIDNVGHQMLRSGEIVPIGVGASITQYNEEMENWGASGGACLYRKKMIDQIGFFDPYFDTGYEDAEFGARAKIQGFHCILSPNAIVYHKGGNAIKKVFDESYAIRQQVNILYTIVKLYPLPLLFGVALYLLIRYLLLIIVMMFTFKIKWAKILIVSIFKFLTTELFKATNRSKSMNINGNKTLSSLRILSLQKSTFLFDLQRIKRYVVGSKSTALDQYR